MIQYLQKQSAKWHQEEHHSIITKKLDILKKYDSSQLNQKEFAQWVNSILRRIFNCNQCAA